MPKHLDQRSGQTSGTRLNKYLARAGVCSRRKADVLIESGVVAVNGQTVTNFGARVHDGDRVTVRGEPIRPADSVYILMNKPSNTITSVADDRGRETVMDLLPGAYRDGGVFPVGRLDRDTTGVLLLTNDGLLGHRLMHPSFEINKRYRVRSQKPISPVDVRMLKDGVELDDGLARADDISEPTRRESNVVTILLHQGRNRQIHRMFEAIGHSVSKLDRIEYAGIRCEKLKRGMWRLLTESEMRHLRILTGIRSTPGTK